MIFTRSQEFTESLDSLAAEFDQVEAAVSGVTWTIEHDPYSFPEVPGLDIRVATFRDFTVLPQLRLYYRITQDPHGEATCFLMALRRVEGETTA